MSEKKLQKNKKNRPNFDEGAAFTGVVNYFLISFLMASERPTVSSPIPPTN